VPAASRLTPVGSVTFAVTCAAGPEPVLSTVKPTIPVAPCVSVPTGLIRAAIWACRADAVDAAGGVAVGVAAATDDGRGPAGAGWLSGDTGAGWVGRDADGAEPGVPGAGPGAPGTEPAEPGEPAAGREEPGAEPGAPGADGPEPGWREADGPGPGDVDTAGVPPGAAAGGRARWAGTGPECPVSARAAAARPTTAATAIPAATCWPLGARRNQPSRLAIQAPAGPLPAAEAR